MKESVTKFDLESAFKALDELEIPVSEKGIRANRPALTEIFSRKTKFDSLFEEYYDIGNTEELEEAQEARDAEIAKAKLARIEKIVDLDAESPEDLLTSYVGKYIMQCPQCMTLFYKDKEDIVESEEDSDTVNVNEVCQHCGNESGYTLIGKVGEATSDEADNFDLDAEISDEAALEEPAEEGTEENEGDVEDLDIDLDALDLEDVPAEENAEEDEKKEESFMTHNGETLVEEIKDDADLDAKLKAHSEYIEYLRNAISDEEAALEKATNDQIKEVIQKRIDAYKEDLEAALPDAVKAEEIPADEEVEETNEEPSIEETQEEEIKEALTESLTEDSDLEVSADEFEELINSPEFKKPISDTTVRAMLDSEDDNPEKKEDVKEACEESKDCVTDEPEALDEGKFGDWLKDSTRWTNAQKADWILQNAKKTDGTTQRFNNFIIACFKNKDKDGNPVQKKISAADPKLELGAKPQVKTDFKSAEGLAKGWSMRQDGGPAFVYVAEGTNDPEAVLLAIYFEGKLTTDQIKQYFDVVKTELKGIKKVAKNGGIEETSENPDNEKLSTIMETLEEIQEGVLESLIADTLVETYQNVAGYRLTNCEYVNESLTIAGTVYFTSGNTRKITYSFNEAYTENGKLKLCGLNEKLGTDKHFTITGNIDKETKTLITESFSCNKK